MRTVTALALLCAASLLVSCESTSLSDQEAIRLIRESKGYPKLASISLGGVKQDSPLGREVMRLVTEGFLTPGGYLTGHTPTEKGKELVERCVWNDFYREWEIFNPFTHKLDVTRIVDKRIDKQQGTAVVIYEVVTTQTPYFAELRKIDPQRVDAALPKSDKFTAEAYFQRWEKGWRTL